MKKSTISATGLACAISMIMASPAFADSTKLTATLDGASVPTGGDANGEGSFTANVYQSTNRICYQLRESNLSTVTKAHIHEGASGDVGRPVVDLEIESDQCVDVSPNIIQALLDSPGDYYVDILTTQYKQGAIRGQLALVN